MSKTKTFGEGWNLTTQDKAEILAGVSVDESEEYADFRRVYNIGLPLAFAYHHGIISLQESVLEYINSTYSALMEYEGNEPEEAENDDNF